MTDSNRINEIRPRFEVLPFPLDSHNPKGWVVVTRYCCFCGCSTRWAGIYKTKEDATRVAIELTLAGEKPECSRYACANCFREYAKEYIL